MTKKELEVRQPDADLQGHLDQENNELDPPIPGDIIEAVEAVGLYYVMDGEPGYSRSPAEKGFTYANWQGRPITDPKKIARFNALAIPPAWTNVWICSRPTGHILATGRDAKGRKQYRYHPKWNEIRSQNKFAHLLQFGQALSAIRTQVEADLRLQGLTHRKVTALVIYLLEQTLIRVGNPEYARSNRSYGLTTLLDDHLTIDGATITLEFVGKSSKPVRIDMKDRRLARLVKRCQDLPGQSLFQYLEENGQCCRKVTSGDVNNYLREVSGQDFSAKEFRTWGGTVRAASELYALGKPENEKQAEKNIVQVVKRVSGCLNNTATVCRKYYIHPHILAAYRDGSLFLVMDQALQAAAEHRSPTRLSAVEHAVMELLHSLSADPTGE